jgi:hypothetical protein
MNQGADTDVPSLINAIEGKTKQVHTQSLDLSFNELLDMENEGELNITPEYQRLFQWDEGARSRFIESLLLEMPVPPIYVVEESDGKYTLIDGLQRISSYLHFRGKLNAVHLDPPVKIGEKLALIDCDIVKELNGKTFDELGTALQIRIKRAFVRVEVVRKGSDPHIKYYMFKRLNTGGKLLSQQQVRNCTIRMLDPGFNDFIIELSKNEQFKVCTEFLTEEQSNAAFDQELVLRFFALKNDRENFKHDVSDFLTEYMEMISDPESKVKFDYNCEKIIFFKTFEILSKTLGDRAFAYKNPRSEELTRTFSIYHFEAFSIGLQPSLDKIKLNDSTQLNMLAETFVEIKKDPAFIKITTGGGKNSRGPLRERIEFIERKISEVL